MFIPNEARGRVVCSEQGPHATSLAALDNGMSLPTSATEPRSTTDATTTVQSGALHAKLIHTPTLSLAMVSTDTPAVEQLSITNVSGTPLNDVVVEVLLGDSVAPPWKSLVPALTGGATYNFRDVRLGIEAGRLREIEAATPVELRLTASCGPDVLNWSGSILLLPPRTWQGTDTAPSLLAAFVESTADSVDQVVDGARGELQATGDGDQMVGYERRYPERAERTLGALISTIRGLAVRPVKEQAASPTGRQQVRTAVEVLEERTGTSIDLSVLIASCLEHCGFHPVIAVTQQRALVGAWCSDESNPVGSSEDGERVRSLVDAGRICLVDLEAALRGSGSEAFLLAQQSARRALEPPTKFGVFVDVVAARREGVRPLSYAEPPSANQRPSASLLSRIPRDVARIQKWKEKLLDLSARNRLLNFRNDKKSLPIACPNLAKFEDDLALGDDFAIIARHDHRDGGSAGDFLLKELHKRRLYSDVSEDELTRRTKRIAREARLSLEENGTNTLFLALGFLDWFDPKSTDKPRRAPLILVPVELARASAREPYRLQRIDDETRINVTLLEKLRVEHAIEIPELADEIPMDHAGVDVPLILKLFRDAVTSIPKWEVEETVALGLLSFTKFLMWNDLDKGADKLLQNPVIRHLANGSAAAFAGQDFPSPDELDRTRAAEDTFCPLDADSTQLAAVFAAEAGRTFVLEGPPGTGKSQTIANLICQCLGQGKTVLFVSEKMAALSVVHRRLAAVGLGEFCLELHSNKARKKELLDKLDHSWDALGAELPGQWVKKAQQLQDLRASLNRVVSDLHKKRGESGTSVFAATSILVGLRGAKRVRLDFGSPSEISQERLEEMQEAVDRLATAAQPVAPLWDHPWRGVGLCEWSPNKQDQAIEAVDRIHRTASTLSATWTRVVATLPCSESPSHSELAGLTGIATLLLGAPIVPAGLLEPKGWQETEAIVVGWVAHGRRRDEMRARLEARYDSDHLLALDVRSLSGKFRQWSDAFWLLAFFILFGARWTLRKALKRGERLPTNREITSELDNAIALADEKRHVDKVQTEALGRLGRIWTSASEDSQWDAIDALLKTVDDLRGSLRRHLAMQSASRADRLGELLQLVSDESPLHVEAGAARQALNAYCLAFAEHDAARTALLETLDLDEATAWGDTNAPGHVASVLSRVGGWRYAPTRLRDWCHYKAAVTEAEPLGFKVLVDAYQAGDVKLEELGDVFDRSFYEWWLNATIEADKSLRRFRSVEHTRLIEQFRALDVELRDLSKEVVRAKLASRIPHPSGAVDSSEMGILMRELRKKGRHMPIRKLFEKIPTLLRRLKPCFLMSPLSIAQYLGTNYNPFDIVVFDEASQIPTHDAIGAVGRGNQLVVVGDTKQMPPTSFFSKGASADEVPDEDEIVELESVLEECLAVGFPRRHLGWHYRSRHESLITFSNYHYYRNQLNTFPAAVASRKQLGVSWQHVPGYYDKGKTRTNEAEARTIAQEIVRRLKDPALQQFSIGVVTFSMAQQALVEDMLEDERRQHPEIERYFNRALQEPLLVKNLENIQGDERDIMLFSIGYAPDKSGSLTMSFGPLNRVGGERRLNVAVTRARYQLVVYSTLRAEDIDLSRTRAVGAHHLRSFLEYAARGPEAIAEASVPTESKATSALQADIRTRLTSSGWNVAEQVGCSGYRIDLAVEHREEPGRYLLGIECDGENYGLARCARDRDRLRALVLRGLGWQLHRVWSSDWWHDPKAELERIEATLRAIASSGDVQHRVGAWADLEAQIESEEIDAAPQPGLSQGPRSIETARERTPHAAAVIPSYPLIPTAQYVGTRGDFHKDYADEVLTNLLNDVVEREAPVHILVATRRVIESFGLKRSTDKTVTRIRALLTTILPGFAPLLIDEFLWKSAEHRAEYRGFRGLNPDNEEQRKFHEVPIEEIANAADAVLTQNISLSVDVLAKEAVRLLGAKRASRDALLRARHGVMHLVARGGCKLDGEQVTHTES